MIINDLPPPPCSIAVRVVDATKISALELINFDFCILDLDSAFLMFSKVFWHLSNSSWTWKKAFIGSNLYLKMKTISICPRDRQGWQPEKPADRQSGKPAGRQAGKQTSRQTGR
jgi:hypothetical protein